MTEQPPGYPFPEDEIIYCTTRDYDDFDSGEDSYFALARLPQPSEHIFDGTEHFNTHRLTMHTPEKGSVSFLMNHYDFENLIPMLVRGFLDSQEEVMAEEFEEPMMSLTWLEDMADVFVDREQGLVMERDE